MPARNIVDVQRVKELLAKGLTQTQVCLRLGIAKSAVSRIASGTDRRADK
jgi:transcriptional regulator with XRE-family HTH domain